MMLTRSIDGFAKQSIRHGSVPKAFKRNVKDIYLYLKPTHNKPSSEINFISAVA